MLAHATKGSLGVLLLVLALTPVLLFNPNTAQAGNAKADVCHVPPDNPDNFHTITINANALSAHLGHADLAGACNGLCAEICDDGDACTVDDSGDCEEAGCPAFPQPVNCDDGNLCTVDSCDSELGCANEPVLCEAPDACHVAACDPVDGSCAVTPIGCPPGHFCDPVEGCVPETVVECPCFTLADLEADGGIYVCGEGYIADGVINYFLNANYYCSGSEGCTQDQGGNPVTGCGYLKDYDPGLGTWTDQFALAISDAEDQACRAILQANCDAQGDAQRSSALNAPAEGAEIPPVLTVQPD
ncbi:MAG: hypothetical protein HKN58_03005 [Xanthomonadales bacterium]|nr:hypothetical protein [Xanthomonadales bacterium]